MKHRKHLALLLFVASALLLQAQDKHALSLREYLTNVANANAAYVAEKYNINRAEANLKAAEVFPDPELSLGYTNNEDWNLQMGYGIEAEISFTLELGGKRKARIRVAQSEKELTDALLNDYFHNLRADATLAYLTALKQEKRYEIQRTSYLRMLSLAQADSLRLQQGIITEVDARQSSLEAAAMLNELYAYEGERQASLLHLLFFQGKDSSGTPDSITGEWTCPTHTFALPGLIVTAQNNRADLQAAIKSKELSQNNLRLARANRAMDLGVSLGGNYASEVRNQIAPAPAFTGIAAGIRIPLKFSNTNRGELRAAQWAAMQSEEQYRAIELQIASEVTQAWVGYQTACQQVEHFRQGMLNEAELILQKKLYSYERGETSILEALNAQRTYNDMQMNYNETLYNCASALTELERSCAIQLHSEGEL
ncbi:MAG: TolC family protein [Tannerellaceae bacterium]|nr:TolC family protein [Tannerellaceae bacterium]